jgi:hypothetical protein
MRHSEEVRSLKDSSIVGVQVSSEILCLHQYRFRKAH